MPDTLPDPTGDDAVKRRILLVDDHPLFLDALKMTVEGAFSDAAIQSASRLNDALQLLEGDAAFHLIVLDLNLPDVAGADGLIRLRAKAPKTPVIVVSSLNSQAIVETTRGAGAAGYIAKDAPRDRMVAAFETVLGGGTYFEKDFDSGINDNEYSDIVGKMRSLTPQQSTILTMICEGKLNKQIAYELDIAETTVKAHVTAILRKMGGAFAHPCSVDGPEYPL